MYIIDVYNDVRSNHERVQLLARGGDSGAITLHLGPWSVSMFQTCPGGFYGVYSHLIGIGPLFLSPLSEVSLSTLLWMTQAADTVPVLWTKKHLHWLFRVVPDLAHPMRSGQERRDYACVPILQWTVGKCVFECCRWHCG